VQPIFPLFRKPAFDAGITDNTVPEALLYIMFALASRYIPTSDRVSVFGLEISDPWEHFARVSFRKSRFNDENESDAPMSLDDIKISFLLALYEYTNFPGRKAWIRIGSTIRFAIAAGLHQLDRPDRSNAPLVSEAELEEQRLVWWAVWRVDSSINVLASSPLSIQMSDICTALPSSSTAGFTAGIEAPPARDILPADVQNAWISAQDVKRMVLLDSPNFYFRIVSYNRQAAICRRQLLRNPTPELMGEFNQLKQVLPFLKLVLPPAYIAGVRNPSNESIEQHRRRIETLVLLHV
jgi:hypothetical protein